MQGLLTVPPRPFVEDGVAGDVYTLGDGVVEAISFRSVLVTDEDHLLASVFQLAEVWTQALDIRHAPKHLQDLFKQRAPWDFSERGFLADQSISRPLLFRAIG
jgi:hypothetical protein